MEVVTFCVAFSLLVYGFIKKINPSYLVFGFLSLFLPTLTGSFNSIPRYILVNFPIFISAAVFLSNKKALTLIFLTISMLLLCAETILFVRGYWVG